METKQREQLVIPRSRWSGSDAAHAAGTLSRCSPVGCGAVQCCLGHHMSLRGVEWAASAFGEPVAMPNQLAGAEKLFPEWVDACDSFFPTEVAQVLARINDGASVASPAGGRDNCPHRTTQANRELLITHVMGEMGIDVTFVD